MSYNQRDRLAIAMDGRTRLWNDRPRSVQPNGYRSLGPGYTMADLNATRRFTSHVDATLHVQNLADFYQNDISLRDPTAGRTTRAGLRMRF
jgi:outer membrane receptor protein involved in Fe transport